MIVSDPDVSSIVTRAPWTFGRSAVISDAEASLPTRLINFEFTVNTDHAPEGTTILWAWFDQAAPDLINGPPSDSGSTTVGAEGVCSISVRTTLASASLASFLVSVEGSTVTDARAHYRPVTVP